MQTYMHVIPGMDAAAANQVADLILGRCAQDIPTVESSMDAEMDAGGDK